MCFLIQNIFIVPAMQHGCRKILDIISSLTPFILAISPILTYFLWNQGGRTQFSRALLLMQFSVCTRFATPALSVLFFSIIERSVLMVLVFYYKNMSEKVTIQRAQQFSAVSLLPNEPSSKSKNCDWMENCTLGDTPISREPLIRISRNLARKYFRK